jgi:hypothetical protein
LRNDVRLLEQRIAMLERDSTAPERRAAHLIDNVR